MESGVPVHRFYRGKKADAETWLQDQTGSDCMEHCMATGIERSGVKRIRLHDLRHSHASMLVDMGVAPLEIAERLGHEKVETTLNTYSHLYPSTQSKLAGLLDKKHRCV